ncbi:hypothetical protein [Pseudomonas gingeri]|uniref:Uncharacterized protein n=1 Tax=Pseudomonas gingeri TaxID=117681 RepID=A0A7Y8BJV2_9PSED|nr:hypothetical protein [Pseudomonas gingeri]NWB46395.1 hypothetical protein [Pseudomonas gingeri]
MDAEEHVIVSDFLKFPLWRYDEESDSYSPVLFPDELPESQWDLTIRAEFSFVNGKNCKGYIIGLEDIYCVALFGGGRTFFLNKNLPELSVEQALAFMETMSDFGFLDVRDMVPLKYRTTIEMEPYLEVEGVFDMGDDFVCD